MIFWFVGGGKKKKKKLCSKVLLFCWLCVASLLFNFWEMWKCLVLFMGGFISSLSSLFFMIYVVIFCLFECVLIHDIYLDIHENGQVQKLRQDGSWIGLTDMTWYLKPCEKRLKTEMIISQYGSQLDACCHLQELKIPLKQSSSGVILIWQSFSYE